MRTALAAALAACALAVGCGGHDDGGADAGATGAAAPTATAPLPVRPLSVGDEVTARDGTPAPVRKALAGNRVVVVAFLMAAPADDRAVAAALEEVRSDPAYRRAADFFTFRVTKDAAFGDLADQLGVTGTPAVVVIGRDRRLGNRFIGLADDAMIRQAINDAAATAARNPVP